MIEKEARDGQFINPSRYAKVKLFRTEFSKHFYKFRFFHFDENCLIRLNPFKSVLGTKWQNAKWC